MANKDIIALIPARSGSKGVPNKNIMLFNGLPLLAYSIVVAKKSKLIDRVIVSTDSQEYAEIAIKHGAEVPFLRPPEYSTDQSKVEEALKHAVVWLKENEAYKPDGSLKSNSKNFRIFQHKFLELRRF